jgi:hypothetical protein
LEGGHLGTMGGIWVQEVEMEGCGGLERCGIEGVLRAVV